LSYLANAGIYTAEEEIYEYFPERSFFDLGFDVLPKLIGKMYGYRIWDYYIDIGTPENLQQARAHADMHGLGARQLTQSSQIGIPRSARVVDDGLDREEEHLAMTKTAGKS